jgi:RNA polymerase sigma factor (sigma-70 family)
VNFSRPFGERVNVSHARSDAQVISASIRNQGAFAEIFERHFDTIYGYLVRRVGPELATDLASDVFLTAFERRARYDIGRREALPWLYGIAANKLRGHRRSEERRLRAFARTPMLSDVAAGARSAIEGSVAEALVSLPLIDREVLLLFAWADLAYEEIAEALDVPVGTVRPRLNRARRVLREGLAPHSNLDISQEAPQWTN